MSMRLKSHEEKLILENQRLVYYRIRQLEITVNPSDYEDFVSIGTIGLIKAATTFDASKNITFATYASRCIDNEIFMYCRKTKKYANNISINEPIKNSEDAKELTLGDTLEDSGADFVEKIINQEEYIRLVSIVLNCLEGLKRKVLLYAMGNETHIEIAKELNISQGYVSRIKAKAIRKVREVASKQVHYKEVFSMSIIGDEYKISFSSKDIREFNKIFARLLQNITTERLPDFNVECNKERIIIQIPAHPESFSFIAQIIQEIDNYSMSFVSNKDSKKFENDETNNESDIGEKEQYITQSKKIREFIRTLDSFSVKEVTSQFPEISTAIVNNVIKREKEKGLIRCVARGEYVVNKD